MTWDFLRRRIRNPDDVAMPKRSRLSPLFAFSLLLTACQPHQLAWVDDANAEKMAARDTAQGVLRFFSVCGFACDVPGVGSMNAKLCYSKAVIQVIEGTGDVHSSDEESRLNVRARAFAEQYNLLVESHLKRANKSQCDPSTNWDAGFYAMHRYVESLNDNAREAGQVAFLGKQSLFNITLPSNVSFEQASPTLCKLIAANGLARVAVVELTHRDQADAVGTPLQCAINEGSK